MSKYRFQISEPSFIEFTKEEFENFEDVDFTDGSKGKIIPVARQYDNKKYQLIVPLEMIEEIKEWLNIQN